jgi:GntR family transcriptional repressor for pyruvate dehydrogenase complex
LYTRIQPERLYEQIVSQIERRIVNGDLKVGSQLPPETELAKQFGVSRTAVREAIKALREKGLVEVQAGRGTFVTNGTSRAVRHSLALMAQIGKAEGQASLVEVRELFEPEIAALAAARATEENVRALRESVAAMDDALLDAEAFIEADLDFHLALAEATQNAIIPNLIDSIVDLLREQRMRIFHVEGGPERGQYHHKRILEAVAHRDPAAARTAMHTHLRQVREDSQASTADSAD